MKILVISNYQDAYNSIRPEGEIFIGLQNLGFQITIMTQCSAEYIPNFRKVGIKVIDFTPTKKVSWKDIQFIRRTLKAGSYDVLHLFNSKAISNGNFAALGLPVTVLVYRGVIGGSSWLNPNAYLKHLHPRVDGITAVSKSVQQYLQKQIWWNTEKVKHFYKGQNLAWYNTIKPTNLTELGVPKNAFIVTCIANNRTWKGIKYLIQAMGFLPINLPIHLLLIGKKMDSKGNLYLINKSKYKDHIHLLGYRNDVVNILAASHAYIQPSNANKEGLGKAILEAMSIGTPPIVTDSGGPPEYVTNKISGMVIPSKNPKSIADAIIYLYDNELLRKKISIKAQYVIQSKMSIKQSILTLKKIYESYL